MSIIAVFNQKGGCGRTTTALNLLAAIARRGQRPLGIDLDPQAHLSDFFGVRPHRVDDSLHSFFTGARALADLAQITKSGVALCPSHHELFKLDASLGKGMAAVTRLRDALRGTEPIARDVVIDTPRFMNALTLNALFGCDLLLVPIASDFLSLQSAREVERAVTALEAVFKKRLPRRYLLTRFDASEISLRVEQQVAELFSADEICTARIRTSREVAESPLYQLDVFRHAPDSMGVQDYHALADELAATGFVAVK